jgi:hypothetical protein
MLAALFRTPVANVRAQLANLLGKRTVAGDRVGAQTADRRTLDAAGRTVIFACLAAHVRETIAALGRAVVAGGDAVLGALVQMVTHGVFPLVDYEMQPIAAGRKIHLPEPIDSGVDCPLPQ